MRIFAFDPADYRDTYAEQGWVHIKNGIHPDFFRELRDFAEHSLSATKLDQYAIRGKKEQSLYEFPPAADFPAELFDAVAAVCGLDRETMTLSERHIQAYEPSADPNPHAHKDRFPSQVSVGLSVAVPSESRLVLYPDDHRELNPFNASAALRRSLQPHEQPEVVLKDAREVAIADEPGDVVMFPGSTTWHLRRNSAGSINLYLKVNDFDSDPLGEDPSTALRRERTLALLDGGRGELAGRVPVRSRRLDFVSRQYTAQEWHESLVGALYGEEPFGLTKAQLDLLQLADGRRTVESLVGEVAGKNGRSPESVELDALTLMERGALDLLC
jgi:hypothetical protein